MRPQLCNQCHRIWGTGRLCALSVNSKAELWTMTVFITAQAITVFWITLAFDTFPSVSRKSSTEIGTYNPASLFITRQFFIERTFVWTSEYFPSLFISHNYTSACNIPWYANWVLINIISHSAALGKLQFEKILLWKNNMFSFHLSAQISSFSYTEALQKI